MERLVNANKLIENEFAYLNSVLYKKKESDNKICYPKKIK